MMHAPSSGLRRFCFVSLDRVNLLEIEMEMEAFSLCYIIYPHSDCRSLEIDQNFQHRGAQNRKNEIGKCGKRHLWRSPYPIRPGTGNHRC